MLESLGDLTSKIPLLITTVQQCNDLKEILTKISNEFQNTRNDLNVINRNFEKMNIENISTTIIENMAHFTNHQEKLYSFNKKLKNSIAFLWKLFTPPPPQKKIILISLQKFTSRYYIQQSSTKWISKKACKLQPKFLQKEASENTKTRTDLATEKSEAKIRFL